MPKNMRSLKQFVFVQRTMLAFCPYNKCSPCPSQLVVSILILLTPQRTPGYRTTEVTASLLGCN